MWVAPTQRGMGTNFMSMNVNKKDIVLDFKKAEDRATALELAATCDVTVKIPMRGRADSLNLAVATGIMIYAATA